MAVNRSELERPVPLDETDAQSVRMHLLALLELVGCANGVDLLGRLAKGSHVGTLLDPLHADAALDAVMGTATSVPPRVALSLRRHEFRLATEASTNWTRAQRALTIAVRGGVEVARRLEAHEPLLACISFTFFDGAASLTVREHVDTHRVAIVAVATTGAKRTLAAKLEDAHCLVGLFAVKRRRYEVERPIWRPSAALRLESGLVLLPHWHAAALARLCESVWRLHVLGSASLRAGAPLRVERATVMALERPARFRVRAVFHGCSGACVCHVGAFRGEAKRKTGGHRWLELQLEICGGPLCGGRACPMHFDPSPIPMSSPTLTHTLLPGRCADGMMAHLRCVHEPEKAGTGLLSERIPLPIAPTHSLVVRTVATAAVALALDAQRVETVRAVVEEAVDTATNNSENEDDEVALAALLQGDIKIHRCNRESKRKRLVGPNIKKFNQRLIKSHGHLFASVCC